jgi:hypothetical protein
VIPGIIPASATPRQTRAAMRPFLLSTKAIHSVMIPNMKVMRESQTLGPKCLQSTFAGLTKLSQRKSVEGPAFW